MFKKPRFWLRAIEGVEHGGSAGTSEEPAKGTDTPEETSGGVAQGGANDAGEDHEETDWKTLYEESQQEVDKWKAHSRKWEERAKAKSDSGNESDDIRDRLAQVEQALKESKAETERAEAARVKLEIGAEYGLSKDDIDLLRGTEDEMRALAQRLGDLGAQHGPENPYQGRGGQGSSKKQVEAWYAELKGKPIN